MRFEERADQAERGEAASVDLCSGLSRETANVEREDPDMEICPESELWELRGPESSAHTDEQKYNPQAPVCHLFQICESRTQDLCTLHCSANNRSAASGCEGGLWPRREGTHAGGDGASPRARVCDGAREDDAQPGGHAEKGGAEAAEGQREAAAEGEAMERRVFS